ncbi:hypothetical protein As57867_014770, partial [Aphanomyces stellatus]
MWESHDHPHVLPLIDTFETATFFGVVTPLCTGGTLHSDLVVRKRYSEASARRAMTQLADALAYLHAHGVVHRDVKAENVLLHSSSVHAPLLLADFGFAKRLPWTKGTTCGTPAYMAPEVLLGHAYDAAVDCWSLGVILYMLLSGQPPFP